MGTNARLDKLNGSVAKHARDLHSHDTRLSVIERLYDERIKPAIARTTDNRVNIAVMAAKYGALGVGAGGGITAVVLAALKLAGAH